MRRTLIAVATIIFLPSLLHANNPDAHFTLPQEDHQKDSYSPLRELAELGDVDAEFLLGIMYLTGIDVPENFGNAYLWLSRAAEHGAANAWGLLGVMHLEGKGVHQDSRRAFEYLVKGAEEGSTAADLFLGYMYLYGDGVALNLEEGVRRIRKAAQTGTPEAQLNLSQLYLMGFGVSYDFAKAFALIRSAAEQGYVAAQVSLANHYSRGLGDISRDIVRAYAWYEVANMGGYPTGRIQYLRKSFSKTMTKEQIDKATELAQELWSEYGRKLMTSREVKIYYQLAKEQLYESYKKGLPLDKRTMHLISYINMALRELKAQASY